VTNSLNTTGEKTKNITGRGSDCGSLRLRLTTAAGTDALLIIFLVVAYISLPVFISHI
jgi:hypothetical protein